MLSKDAELIQKNTLWVELHPTTCLSHGSYWQRVGHSLNNPTGATLESHCPSLCSWAVAESASVHLPSSGAFWSPLAATVGYCNVMWLDMLLIQEHDCCNLTKYFHYSRPFLHCKSLQLCAGNVSFQGSYQHFLSYMFICYWQEFHYLYVNSHWSIPLCRWAPYFIMPHQWSAHSDNLMLWERLEAYI